MTGIRRVIVGASGSPASLRALRYAEELARANDALLIPVLAWIPWMFWHRPLNPDQVLQDRGG